MKDLSLAALTCALVATAAVAANPFDAFKGKVKEGLYEYRMDMDMGQMPGMPAGMGKQTHTFQHCVTAEDIQRGEMSRSDQNRKPQNCDFTNFHMSGNTATYTMVCKGGPDMTADNRITFKGDGYDLDTKVAMNQGGHVMNMKEHMQARYLGACK